ncbi:FHA domain-containing protein [Streptomyces lydicus]|nr:FHA domain-containing protein [Streptomyces lydicus]
MHLLHGGQIRIGRSADADVPLDDPDVSRLHCAVTVEPDGAVYVADLHSTNGTVVDGTDLGERPAPLRPGALLRIGSPPCACSPRPPPGPRPADRPRRRGASADRPGHGRCAPGRGGRAGSGGGGPDGAPWGTPGVRGTRAYGEHGAYGRCHRAREEPPPPRRGVHGAARAPGWPVTRPLPRRPPPPPHRTKRGGGTPLRGTPARYSAPATTLLPVPPRLPSRVPPRAMSTTAPPPPPGGRLRPRGPGARRRRSGRCTGPDPRRAAVFGTGSLGSGVLGSGVLAPADEGSRKGGRRVASAPGRGGWRAAGPPWSGRTRPSHRSTHRPAPPVRPARTPPGAPGAGASPVRPPTSAGRMPQRSCSPRWARGPGSGSAARTTPTP